MALDCSREILSFRRSRAGHGVCEPIFIAVAMGASTLIADQMSAAGHLDIRGPIFATAATHAGHTW